MQKKRWFIAALPFLLAPFIAGAQDSLLGRKGIGIDAGFTIAYPILFSQYQYNSSYSPVSGGGPLIIASYDYSFVNRKHSILGIRFKGGYFQNHYLYQVTPTGGGAVANEYEYRSYLGAGIGLYMIKKIKKVGFYNEVNIFGKSQIEDHYSNSAQQPQAIDLACEGASNIFLNFQSGLAFYFMRNVAIMPFLAYPVFEVSNVALWFPKLVTRYSTNANDIFYSSFSAGISFTYYF